MSFTMHNHAPHMHSYHTYTDKLFDTNKTHNTFSTTIVIIINLRFSKTANHRYTRKTWTQLGQPEKLFFPTAHTNLFLLFFLKKKKQKLNIRRTTKLYLSNAIHPNQSNVPLSLFLFVIPENLRLSNSSLIWWLRTHV